MGENAVEFRSVVGPQGARLRCRTGKDYSSVRYGLRPFASLSVFRSGGAAVDNRVNSAVMARLASPQPLKLARRVQLFSRLFFFKLLT